MPYAWVVSGMRVAYDLWPVTHFFLDCCELGTKRYSHYFRLSDLYQVYGSDTGKDKQNNTTEENNKTTSRYGKTGDIYSLVSEDVFLF